MSGSAIYHFFLDAGEDLQIGNLDDFPENKAFQGEMVRRKMFQPHLPVVKIVDQFLYLFLRERRWRLEGIDLNEVGVDFDLKVFLQTTFPVFEHEQLIGAQLKVVIVKGFEDQAGTLKKRNHR
jgi:hypothetical protein